MADLVITRTVRKNGTLADADAAPLLRDAANTFGIRDETVNAVVVVAGTPLVRQSLGTYAYTLANVTPGHTYRYFLQTTIGGATTRDEKVYVAPLASGDAIDALSGRYFSGTGIKAQLGLENTIVSSNLENGSTDPNLARIQADGQAADDYVDYRARNGSKPRTTPIASTNADYSLVQLAANLWASWLLVSHRVWFGRTLDEDAQSAMILSLRKRADALLTELFGGVETADPSKPKPGTFQSVRLAFAPQGCVGDEYSR